MKLETSTKNLIVVCLTLIVLALTIGAILSGEGVVAVVGAIGSFLGGIFVTLKGTDNGNK